MIVKNTTPKIEKTAKVNEIMMEPKKIKTDKFAYLGELFIPFKLYLTYFNYLKFVVAILTFFKTYFEKSTT